MIATIATVTARFNDRCRGGVIMPWTERSASDIANWLLAVLGVRSPAITLPDDRPFVFWNNKPATEALDDLCSIYGLRVALEIQATPAC
jgi:hypothetical protein